MTPSQSKTMSERAIRLGSGEQDVEQVFDGVRFHDDPRFLGIGADVRGQDDVVHLLERAVVGLLGEAVEGRARQMPGGEQAEEGIFRR